MRAILQRMQASIGDRDTIVQTDTGQRRMLRIETQKNEQCEYAGYSAMNGRQQTYTFHDNTSPIATNLLRDGSAESVPLFRRKQFGAIAGSL